MTKKIEHPESAYKDVEFLDSLEGRTIRVLSEYLSPMARLDKAKINSTVLFLGSARANPSHGDTALTKYYWEAEEVAYLLSKWAIELKPRGKKFVVCTGGGPGIMEAANRGAQRAGAPSIGMNITLPQEQEPNPFITPDLSFSFHYFFMRKFWLVYKAKAVVAFPGGYGTFDEFFEIITLLQTSKISKKELSLILYGEDYWKKIINFDGFVKAGAITPMDRTLFTFCSTPKQAFQLLKKTLTACR
jgi:uncharacterized protein (TIGR00730 family)